MTLGSAIKESRHKTKILKRDAAENITLFW